MIESVEKLTKEEHKELRRIEREQIETRLRKQAQMKKIGIWVGAILLLIGSVWGLAFLAGKSDSTISFQAPPISKEDISRGPKDAKVTLIEYADFQCPACASYNPIVKKLHTDYADKVLFVYRYFPLAQHKNGKIAAQASYAALQQGKFWEMHDMLYEKQKEWETDTHAQQRFVAYAVELQLDINQFMTDIESEAGKKMIDEQQTAGITAGVDSTPTFFLNGEQIQNPGAYADFKAIIDEKLAASK